ncbi:hypothetical protein ACS0TY_016262 [Phlomoides rotata]
MSPPSSENTIRGLLKPWKNHISHPANFAAVLNANFMKGFLTVIIFATFSLYYFSLLPTYELRFNCPECDQISVRTTYKRFAAGRRREEKTEISHIMFGIGGSAATWRQRRHYCELWWKPNITRGFVWLDKEPSKDSAWPATSPPYRVSGNTARFKYTNWEGSRSAVRLARIVKESFEIGSENVRWFVMGDDDTVFFTENLVNLLNKYDHKQMYYIGGISESVEQDMFHSYEMAYGGGGFAVSYPLAAELVNILDGCIDRYAEFYGSDLKVGACVNELGVPFTREAGFHQMDIRGSPLGLLSAHPVAPLISLHHLDYIHPLFPGSSRVDSVRRLIRVYNTDPSRVLQHSVCYSPTRNWSISISWGYNVQLYPYYISPKDLSTPLQTFLTWGTWSRDPFTFNTRLISFDSCERPILHYFDQIYGSGYGSTMTSYKMSESGHRRPCGERSYEDAYLVKGFNVSATFLDPSVWKKSPRRQCCEIINDSDQLDGIVELRIRGCNQWETATPS